MIISTTTRMITIIVLKTKNNDENYYNNSHKNNNGKIMQQTKFLHKIGQNRMKRRFRCEGPQSGEHKLTNFNLEVLETKELKTAANCNSRKQTTLYSSLPYEWIDWRYQSGMSSIDIKQLGVRVVSES